MSKKLLSAYELANQRIIFPEYTPQRENEEEESAIPDFIDSWERPDKGEPSPVLLEEGHQTSFYDKNNTEKQNNQQKNTNMIAEQGKETINFSQTPMEVHWYGHFTTYSGFSRQNRAYAFGLSNRNTRVKVDIQKSPMEINKTTEAELELLSQIDIDPAAPKVYGATVPLRLAHGGPKILYTMMETSETLHENYVGKINLYDEIWVPTNYGKELFKKNGVRPNIRVMPLGVDPKRYHCNAKPINFELGLKNFVFLSVFKWGYRKGYDILLKAFMEEFSAHDEVSLLMVSRTDLHHKPQVIVEDFKNIRNGVLKNDEDLPHIALYDKLIREKDMPGVYASANAFVMISRGEGFGLPYVEAASVGLPIIASNCSGHSDFLNAENSYLVDPEGYSEARINGNMSKLAKHCGFYENQSFPNFGRDSIEQTKAHMRNVYENYSSAQNKALILEKTIREEYTWDQAIDRVHYRLREISE